MLVAGWAVCANMTLAESISWMTIITRKECSRRIRECSMRLVCYKAMCGDAFHLRFVGDSGNPRNIFLDMGHPKTYSTVLKDVVRNLIGKSEHIDALFLSHIHDDHIGGTRKR